jgi:hypothetical protein
MNNKAKKYIAVLIIAAVLVAALVVYGVRCADKAGFYDVGESNDFTVFYRAAETVAEGGDPYDPANTGLVRRPFLYPPVFAVLMVPLTWVGYGAAVIIWYILNAWMLVLSVLLCVLIVRDGRERVSAWVWVIPALMTMRVLDSNFQCGQANVPVMFLLFLGLYMLRRKRDTWAGVFVSAAAVVKLTPLIFLAYFAYKRLWRALAAGIAGVLIFFLVVPSLVLGPGRSLELNAAYASRTVSFATGAAGGAGEAPGQSLFAAGLRYLTPINAAHHAKEPRSVNIVSLPRGLALCIIAIAALLLAALTARAARVGMTADRETLRHALEYSAVILLMLLISPVSRKAHFVVMLLPHTAAVYYLMHTARVERWGKTLLAALVFSFAAFTLSADAFVGKEMNKTLLAYTVFFFGALALWAAITGLIRERQPTR